MLALLLGALVAALYVAPHLYFAAQPEYQGIYMAETTDENFYVTAINRSYTSPAPIGDPYQYEYQNIRNPYQYFALEFLLGKIGAGLGLSIEKLVLGMKAVFPFMLTLLVYTLSFLLSQSRGAALLAAAAVLLGNELARPSLTATFHTLLLDGPWVNFMLFERPINPQVSALFFFGTLIALLSLMRAPRSKVAIGIAGASLGVLAYIYFFFWAFAAMFTLVLFCYALLVRDRSLVSGAFFAGVLSIIVASPFLYAVTMGFLDSATALLHAVPTHRIIIEKMVLLPLFIYAFIFAWSYWSFRRPQLPFGEDARDFSRKYLFVLLLLVTGVVVSNHQVITGKLVQQQHFHFFTNIPIFILAMSLLGAEMLSKITGGRMFVLANGVAIAFLFWFGVGEQVSSYRKHYADYIRYQKLVPIYEELNIRENGVVLASDHMAMGVTMYTHARVYASPYDSNFKVPRERLVHDYFVRLAIRGVTPEKVREYVYDPKHRNEISYLLFGGLYYRDLCGSAACFPDSILEDLIRSYQEFSQKSVLSRIHEYRADYLLWDRKTDKEWQVEGIVTGAPLYESSDFALYAIAR